MTEPNQATDATDSGESPAPGGTWMIVLAVLASVFVAASSYFASRELPNQPSPNELHQNMTDARRDSPPNAPQAPTGTEPPSQSSN